MFQIQKIKNLKTKCGKRSEYLQVTNSRHKNHDFPLFSIPLGVKSFFLEIQKTASYFISKSLKKALVVRTAGGHYKNNLTSGITFKGVTNGIIVSSCCHAGHRVRNSNVISAFTVRTILKLSKRNSFANAKKLKQGGLRLLLGIGLTQVGLGCWTLSTALCLTGCMGVYEGGFECPPGEGVRCKSISEVNHMVDQCSVPGIQCLEREKATSEIWYSPFFTRDGKEKKKARCLDATNSI